MFSMIGSATAARLTVPTPAVAACVGKADKYGWLAGLGTDTGECSSAAVADGELRRPPRQRSQLDTWCSEAVPKAGSLYGAVQWM